MQHEQTQQWADDIMERAAAAFQVFRKVPGRERASLLENIGQELELARPSLIPLAAQESHLPEGRLNGELSRTINQLNLFATLLREGSWVQAAIDTALPQRQPAPRADIRKMMQPVGPVLVFGSSNFPFAFSTLGGDSASALAAGCPVVVKAHPGHPETSKAVHKVALNAIEALNLSPDILQHVPHNGHHTGLLLVTAQATAAVGFTGSFQGGSAIIEAAQKRLRPISVYAEMGSLNPVVILPAVMKATPEAIAQKLAGSVCLGVGQFCTNPGLIFVTEEKGHEPALAQFIQSFTRQIRNAKPGAMLHEGILESYHNDRELILSQAGVELLAEGETADRPLEASAALASVRADTFMHNGALQKEVFGPFTLLVIGQHIEETKAAIKSLEGQLTASIFADSTDKQAAGDFIDMLLPLTGRLIFNDVPTGVEVSAAMVHGGPYPATSNAQFTSVGTTAIQRWVRPVCFQDFPEDLLPVELQDANPLSVWRTVDGNWTNKAI